MSIGSISINTFDIVVLAIVLISLILAASRGFFREFISILALGVAILATLFVWGRLRTAVQNFIQPEWLADVLLGATVFFVAYGLAIYILRAITRGLRGRRVGFFDRLLGAVFGAARGLIIAALGVMLFTADYREAKDMQAYAETLSDSEREVFRNAPQRIRDMVNTNSEVDLPEIFQGSALFPLLERIGDGIRALPFGEMKTMAERLRDGEDVF